MDGKYANYRAMAQSNCQESRGVPYREGFVVESLSRVVVAHGLSIFMMGSFALSPFVYR